MNNDQKMTLANALLGAHERAYGTEVPERVREFWEDEAFDYHRKCLPKGTTVPTFEPGSFRLVLALPSWDLHASFGGLDDAIVGPEGEWEHAKDFLPLFVSEQSRYIVADLTAEECPVGWFEEETFREGGKGSKGGQGYDRGVFPLAPSLDEFLKMLVTLDDADYETEEDDEIWENAAESLETSDEDED